MTVKIHFFRRPFSFLSDADPLEVYFSIWHQLGNLGLFFCLRIAPQARPQEHESEIGQGRDRSYHSLFATPRLFVVPLCYQLRTPRSYPPMVYRTTDISKPVFLPSAPAPAILLPGSP